MPQIAQLTVTEQAILLFSFQANVFRSTTMKLIFATVLILATSAVAVDVLQSLTSAGIFQDLVTVLQKLSFFVADGVTKQAGLFIPEQRGLCVKEKESS
jgi:hypothetical protein